MGVLLPRGLVLAVTIGWAAGCGGSTASTSARHHDLASMSGTSTATTTAADGATSAPTTPVAGASATTSATANATAPVTTGQRATTNPTSGASTVPTSGPSGCVNSSAPACGPFTWDPQPPANQPLTVSIHFDPAAPRAGQTVTFTVTFSDPDSQRPATGCDNQSEDYGDGSPVVRHVCDPTSPCTWYGPHTPPAASGDSWVATFTHMYATAGTYAAQFSDTSMTPGTQALCVDAHSGRSGDPYSSLGTGSVTVSVAA